MYLTVTDVINMKISMDKIINDSEIIKTIVSEDSLSVQKKLMKTAEKYYVGEHDVLLKNFNSSTVTETDEYENEHEKKFVNPNASNHHNIAPFHRVLVDQKVSYLLSREPSISVDGSSDDEHIKEYEKMLCKFCDEGFNEKMQVLLTGASNHGFEAIHVYYDENGNLKYCVVPADELIPIYDTNYQTELQAVIRYYTIVITKNGRKYMRHKVEWWTENDVTYYEENDMNGYILNSSLPYNPAPHWWEFILNDGIVKEKKPHSWGRVPFIILKNNEKLTTDLQCIKGLIDAYDILSSQGTNNFIDLVELYWVIQGYGGEAAGAIAKKLQINKAVNISDSSGTVDAKQVQLPVDGRISFMKMLRKDIFNFGMGIDVDDESFGQAPSGVSLKFRYAQLDLKCGKVIPGLKRCIKELLGFVTDDYNMRYGTDYDSSLINVSININRITNDSETVQMIKESVGIVSKETLLAKHPFVDDVNDELLRLESEENKENNKFLSYPPFNKRSSGGEADE